MNILLPFLVLLWPLGIVLNAIRLRKIAEAELAMAESVTAMQDLLLRGSIRLGDASHDILFNTMQAVMLHQRYSLPWDVFRPESDAVRAFTESLRTELDKKDCPFKPMLDRFNHAYFKAFRYKHPLQFAAFPLYLLGVLMAARGIITGLKAVIHMHDKFCRIGSIFERRYIEVTAPRELRHA